jgi:hypothetical protein
MLSETAGPAYAVAPAPEVALPIAGSAQLLPKLRRIGPAATMGRG